MKELSIRFKTIDELSNSDRFPFIVTIDGVERMATAIPLALDNG